MPRRPTAHTWNGCVHGTCHRPFLALPCTPHPSGGGYSYRLCPKPKHASQITEECFQRTPLRFVGDTQWLQYGGDEANRTEIPAVRVSAGTAPEGSQWTRNPLPACGTFDGGGELQQVCLGSQFPPPAPGASGFYGLTPNDVAAGTTSNRRLTQWSVVDRVRVPADIEAGEYVLSFRMDCEQTPQVWSYCADVRIVQAPPAVAAVVPHEK